MIRPEATGYGCVYYVEHMIQYASGGKESFKGKRVAISGSGNVAQYAALKVIELGGTVVSLSDSKGALIAEGSNMGCTQEAIDIFEAHRKESQGQAIWYAPGKAANAGGVAVSGLEMAQNSQRMAAGVAA